MTEQDGQKNGGENLGKSRENDYKKIVIETAWGGQRNRWRLGKPCE